MRGEGKEVKERKGKNERRKIWRRGKGRGVVGEGGRGRRGEWREKREERKGKRGRGGGKIG